MTSPLIGLTSVRVIGEYDRWRDALSMEYSNAIVRAGGLPVLIPLGIVEHGDDTMLRTLYERVDGILITGGGDIHPACYGEALTEHEDEIIPARDQIETTLARWAFEDNRPLFGICRGQQVMNVALGGTLIHDIPTELNGKGLVHRQASEMSRSQPIHEVEIKDDSRLARIIGCNRIAVNSIHHQSVGKLAEPLKVTATADDGIIEGVEVPDAYFYVGVQWHPEWLLDTVPEMQALFRQFVQACTR